MSRQIITHFKNSLDRSESIVLIVLLIIVPVVPTYFLKDLSESSVTILLAVISILGGLLFNLLVLFWSEAAKYKQQEIKLKLNLTKKEIQNSKNAVPLKFLANLQSGLNIIFHHISFNLLIAIINMIFLIGTLLFPTSFQESKTWHKYLDLIISIFCYEFMFIFFYSVFLTLRKVHSIYINTVYNEH